MHMKKYIFYFVGLIVLGTSIQSCTDNYLEEVNPNAISADIYWSNLNESEENLTSVYAAMLNHFVMDIDIEAWRSDISHPKDRRNPYGKALPWYRQTFTNTNAEISKRWDAQYQVIWRANQVITGLNGMSDDLKSQERWTEQMAQARFFRGLVHFYLHSTYNEGNIIIRDFIPVTDADFSIPVSSSEEVIEFFREDLLYAYENLPSQFENKTRVTAGTAATILGTSYLYTASEGNTADYTTAKQYLYDVMYGDYGYQLLTGNDIELLFTHAGDYNSESIFELNYADSQQTEETQWDEESFFNRWARYSAPTGTFQGSAYIIPAAWITYAYSTESMNTQDPRNYDDEGNLNNIPLRAAQMMAVVNDEHSEYYLSPTANKVFGFGNTQFSIFKKHTNHDVVASEADIAATAWKSGKNVIVNRLADVYLMYAECLIMGDGNIEGGIEYINYIRDRWGLQLLDANASLVDGTPYTIDTLMDHLMFIERPLELAVEGYATRSIDLRRWGVAAQRFQELSELDFNLVGYQYTNADGDLAWRNKSLLQPGLSPDPEDNSITISNEYDDAAANYNEALHAYFPLPLSEVLNNSNTSN